jgi:hypothetical protein
MVDILKGTKDNADPYENRKKRRHLRKKSLSESATIQIMRDIKTFSSTLDNERSPLSTAQDDLYHLLGGSSFSETKGTTSESNKISRTYRESTINNTDEESERHLSTPQEGNIPLTSSLQRTVS